MGVGVIWESLDVWSPRKVAVDVEGNAHIAYSNSSGTTVRKLSPMGAEIWSSSEVPQGKFIGLDASGNVYVGYLDRIRKLNSSGAFQWDIPIEAGATLHALAVDQLGNVYAGVLLPKMPGSGYIFKSSSLVIRKYSPSGRLEWTNTLLAYTDFAANPEAPTDSGGTIWDLSTDLLGNIVFGYFLWWKSSNINPVYTYQYTTTKLNSLNGQIWTRSANNQNQAVATDLLGNTYIEEGAGTVLKFDPSGEPLWEKTFDYGPIHDIATDQLGNVYLAYYWPGSTVKINSSGDQLWVLTSSSNDDAEGIGVDPTGRYLYVTHSGGSVRRIGNTPARGRSFADGFILGYQSGDRGNKQSMEAVTAAPGPKGPPGDQGPPGPVGEQGYTGSRGPRGVTGLKGLTGPTGATGLQGATGIGGIQGIVGDKGETSTEQGAKGDTGPQGPQGPRQPNPIGIQLYDDGVIVTYADASVESQSITKNSDKRFQSIGVTTINYVLGNTP